MVAEFGDMMSSTEESTEDSAEESTEDGAVESTENNNAEVNGDDNAEDDAEENTAMAAPQPLVAAIFIVGGALALQK